MTPEEVTKKATRESATLALIPEGYHPKQASHFQKNSASHFHLRAVHGCV